MIKKKINNERQKKKNIVKSNKSKITIYIINHNETNNQ